MPPLDHERQLMATDAARRLDGWKAIAHHLGRDVRTVQRWRDERAMPVYRLPGRKGGAVCADRAELDAWLFHATSGSEQLNTGSKPAAPAVASRLARVPLWSSARLFLGVSAALLAISGVGVVYALQRRARSFSPRSE
jgi:hypothetical protein